MVDFVKRAAKAAQGMLSSDEEIRGAINVTPSPFIVGNAGMTGGMIAGGVLGAALGAAVDKRISGKEGERDLPAISARPTADPPIPTNGALAAVTNKRLLIWTISGLGKPKELIHDVSLGEIDAVVWEDTDVKWMRGKPQSIQVWIGLGGSTVVSTAAISMGPAGKWARGLVDALAAGLPGKVTEFSP